MDNKEQTTKVVKNTYAFPDFDGYSFSVTAVNLKEAKKLAKEELRRLKGEVSKVTEKIEKFNEVSDKINKK